MLSWMSFEMVGPNVFSWSEPIQIRYQSGLWMHVDRAAPRPVPVQMRMPRLYSVDVFETPANLSSRVQIFFGGSTTRLLVKSPCTPQIR
jgi:hypothetical protein